MGGALPRFTPRSSQWRGIGDGSLPAKAPHTEHEMQTGTTIHTEFMYLYMHA